MPKSVYNVSEEISKLESDLSAPSDIIFSSSQFLRTKKRDNSILKWVITGLDLSTIADFTQIIEGLLIVLNAEDIIQLKLQANGSTSISYKATKVTNQPASYSSGKCILKGTDKSTILVGDADEIAMFDFNDDSSIPDTVPAVANSLTWKDTRYVLVGTNTGVGLLDTTEFKYTVLSASSESFKNGPLDAATFNMVSAIVPLPNHFKNIYVVIAAGNKIRELDMEIKKVGTLCIFEAPNRCDIEMPTHAAIIEDHLYIVQFMNQRWHVLESKSK